MVRITFSGDLTDFTMPNANTSLAEMRQFEQLYPKLIAQLKTTYSAFFTKIDDLVVDSIVIHCNNDRDAEWIANLWRKEIQDINPEKGTET